MPLPRKCRCSKLSVREPGPVLIRLNRSLMTTRGLSGQARRQRRATAGRRDASGRLMCAYMCLCLFGSPVTAARSFRADFVFGWSAPSTRSQSASVRLYSRIALAVRPAARQLIASLSCGLRVFGWSSPGIHSNSGVGIIINETPTPHPAERSRQGAYPRLQTYEIYTRSYYPDDFMDVPVASSQPRPQLPAVRLARARASPTTGAKGGCSVCTPVEHGLVHRRQHREHGLRAAMIPRRSGSRYCRH
jgi:hypothetical protein